jgi:two-component system, chemotaxis family, chemotaxis protein CheY
MTNTDDELAEQYLTECRGRLASIETDLLAAERGAGGDAAIDEQLVNRISRSAHSVGEKGFFDPKTRELAHEMEDALKRVRGGELLPTPQLAGVLLRATHRLDELIQNPGKSHAADNTEVIAALRGLTANPRAFGEKLSGSLIEAGPRGAKSMRALLVEDDFSSRLLLQTFLSRYGECHIAVNGREAVEAFRSRLAEGKRYDLICMDLMMPEMDGREALRQIRALEAANGIRSNAGAKIIMTTAANDIEDVMRCFRELCDAYLVKPVNLGTLLDKMKSFELVP